MRKALFIYSILIAGLSSCIKPPQYPAAPQIKFVSVSSSYVTSGGIDTITFSFTDGDGDIAPNSAYASLDTCIVGKDSSVLYKNYNNVFIFKSNDNFGCSSPDVFASPDLRPAGTYKALSGNIHVYEQVNSSKCFQCSGGTCANGPGGLDSVIFTIYLVDLAGHLSNGIQTTAVLTGCQ